MSFHRSAVPEIATVLLGTFAPRENMEHFVEDLFFCCLMGATCAHAKNYALLLGGESSEQVQRLAQVDLPGALPLETLAWSPAE